MIGEKSVLRVGFFVGKSKQINSGVGKKILKIEAKYA
jgi:hypothetical protein